MAKEVQKLKYMSYKNYVGSLEYNTKTGMYSGQIKLIPTFLHYVSSSRIEVEIAFQRRVDEYLKSFHRSDRNQLNRTKDYRSLFE